MRTIFLNDPVMSGVHEFQIPENYWLQFQDEILPYLENIFQQAKIETEFEEQFGFAWGAVIGSAISAASTWLQSRGGSSSYWSAWSWDKFVNDMKNAGCVTENPKFAYCHHCDGNTYRVWVNNSGAIEYATREKTGSNCRVQCSMLPQLILDQMPACSDGSRPGHKPGGETTPYQDPGGDPDMEKWMKYALVGGVGLVILLALIPKKKKR